MPWCSTRNCLQVALKATSWTLCLAGALIVMFALKMMGFGRPATATYPAANTWFPYTLLALGVVVILVTCSGHIAAQNVDSQCLSCYMITVVLLVLLEFAIGANVYVNKNWERDFPEEPSGKPNEFRNFVKDNFGMFKWLSLSFVVIQAISLTLAKVLRDLGPAPPTVNEDSDDDVPVRLPLLRDRILRVNQT